ncbi:MAG TPA: choice-of-anchor U domain-containing protein, partial [Pseudolysinimonas sp.]|nr:choice-of-anchor U domain-containing protein [Pseudolysinimonas sp.]
RTQLAGLTVMVTTAAGTSVFSNCQISGPALDGDGDGIPDVVEAAYPVTTGLDGVARSAAFVADNQQWVALSANGALSNVSPIDDPAPSGHPGATFPLGLIDWTVSGIDPGSFADVAFTLPGSVITGWWKYSPHHDPAYFDYAYSSIAGYGATVTAQNLPIFGLSTNVVVRVPDGGVGDDDGLENGSVRDPSAPALVDGVAPAPAPVVLTPVAPTVTRQASLARTGTDPSRAVDDAAILLIAGFALLALTLTRRRLIRRR